MGDRKRTRVEPHGREPLCQYELGEFVGQYVDYQQVLELQNRPGRKQGAPLVKEAQEKDAEYYEEYGPLEQWDTSHIGDLNCCFRAEDHDWAGLTADLGAWDVSSVTDMEEMFTGQSNFNGDLSKWDVSKVESMHRMFAYCRKFNRDLSKWDVHEVRSMAGMFRFCWAFNGDVSTWNVHKVENMWEMFQGCVNFNGDLSKWDVSRVENMEKMFCRCVDFNGDLSKWDVSRVEDMGQMFEGCKHFNCDLSEWDVSNVIDMTGMFKGCDAFDGRLSDAFVAKLHELGEHRSGRMLWNKYKRRFRTLSIYDYWQERAYRPRADGSAPAANLSGVGFVVSS